MDLFEKFRTSYRCLSFKDLVAGYHTPNGTKTGKDLPQNNIQDRVISTQTFHDESNMTVGEETDYLT